LPTYRAELFFPNFPSEISEAPACFLSSSGLFLFQDLTSCRPDPQLPPFFLCGFRFFLPSTPCPFAWAFGFPFIGRPRLDPVLDGGPSSEHFHSPFLLFLHILAPWSVLPMKLSSFTGDSGRPCSPPLPDVYFHGPTWKCDLPQLFPALSLFSP